VAERELQRDGGDGDVEVNYEIRANGKLLGRIEAPNIFAAAVIAAQEYFKKPAAFRESGSSSKSGMFRTGHRKDGHGELFYVREA
jgi:hypothetical protein